MLANISGTEASKLAVNPYGSITFSSADGVQTGNFWAIAFDTDCVITAITLAANSSGANRITPLTWRAGTTKFIQFTSITLTSGTATIYKTA